MILNDLMIKFQSWSCKKVKYLFIAITARFTLTQSLVMVSSLSQIELFNNLTVCKQINDAKLNW